MSRRPSHTVNLLQKKGGDSPSHIRHQATENEGGNRHHHETGKGGSHNSKHQRKSSFEEAQELKQQRQKEIDSRINMVFNGEGDEEFRQALLQGDDHPSTGHDSGVTPPLKASQVSEGNKPVETDRQFKLQLDGFTIGQDAATKRDNDSLLDNGIDMKELEAKRKKKAGIYDLEPVDKLKEKGYNLFLDITEAYGQAS